MRLLKFWLESRDNVLQFVVKTKDADILSSYCAAEWTKLFYRVQMAVFHMAWLN